MRHDDDTSFEQANGDKAQLAIGKASILYGHGIAFKHSGSIRKVNAMLAKIRLALLFVPLKVHALIVVTIRSYVKRGYPHQREGNLYLATRGQSSCCPSLLRASSRVLSSEPSYSQILDSQSIDA